MHLRGLLFILLIFTGIAVAAQQPGAPEHVGTGIPKPVSHRFLNKPASNFIYPGPAEGKGVRIIPANFHTQQLGFFCRKELQVQKHTNLNVFFRLGSKEYVDYLERKPNARQ